MHIMSKLCSSADAVSPGNWFSVFKRPNVECRYDNNILEFKKFCLGFKFCR